MPVVEQEGKLRGVLTLDEVLELLCEEITEIGKLIQKESPASLAQL